jgi:hypothetical protein
MQKIPGGNVMKTLPLAIIGAAIVLTSCSSAKYAASSEYDDVYYNPNRAEKQAVIVVEEPVATPVETITAQPIVQEQVYLESQAYTDENLSDYELYKIQREAEMLGETYEPQGSEALYVQQYQEVDTLVQYGEEKAPVIVNNYNYYSDPNDPNDYYYSSNLRRFSDEYYGWDYYDPYYTDYYYPGSRFRWGMSMGWGYPGMGFGFSYGNPYYGSYYPSYWGGGYGGYYDPYYSWGYGGYYGGYYGGHYGGSYWSGYNHGYYHGYYDSRYYQPTPHHYGKLDNRHSYGYSRPSGVTSGNSKGTTYVDPKNRSMTGTTQATAGASRTNELTRVKTSATRTGTVSSANGARTSATSAGVSAARSGQGQRTSVGNASANQRAAITTTRTARPATVQGNSGNARSTYTPSYSKPRTSSSSTYNRSYSQPRSSSSTYKSSSPVSSSPARSSSSYSRPSSSSRSSSSYSRPSSSSRSSSSYSRPSSSPSRSSSSYSGSSSGSSRSSGGSYSRSSSGSSRSSGGSSNSSGGSSRSSGSSSRSSVSRR